MRQSVQVSGLQACILKSIAVTVWTAEPESIPDPGHVNRRKVVVTPTRDRISVSCAKTASGCSNFSSMILLTMLVFTKSSV
eukprot:CAMPEP_0115153324 /NCGR_PEP_ID=MMETSP0227-20121206/66664_1 /TAXON_ID=89957 /ORGANISM="Polarella glacialis, Strain CCMP 1383" /LENGTH=80 /DNA_ID=CAMNT_0002564053 /DNA_START=63 /DNA_END=305 /DNA_ORIENTATION=-